MKQFELTIHGTIPDGKTNHIEKELRQALKDEFPADGMKLMVVRIDTDTFKNGYNAHFYIDYDVKVNGKFPISDGKICSIEKKCHQALKDEYPPDGMKVGIERIDIVKVKNGYNIHFHIGYDVKVKW